MPQRRLTTRRFLATVLFTDIVGSTERAAELGDRAWRDLLERHNAVVRRELKVYEGREMDTAGDGFFAVFEAPERAVRCAESITVAIAPLGIEVRAGVHIGECEVIGGKVGGMAVNIGARIAAKAEPGQVLVSGSVRDLMIGSDRRFEGGDLKELKGVADQWRIYRLVSEPPDGDVVGSRRSPLLPLYTRGRRRRLIGELAAALVVSLAVSAGYLLTRPDPEVTVVEDAIGVIGPGNSPRVSAAVVVGQRPTAVAAGFGSVWVTNSTADSVSRIDRRSNHSVPINVEPGSSPSGLAVGAGAVWVANSGAATVSRIDPTTSRTTTITVRPEPTGIVVAFGSVWVTNPLDASVTEIDPDTNKVLEEVVPVGAGPTGIAAGAGYLWVTNQSDGTVTRFHPKTHVADPPVPVGNGPVGIAVSDGAAWVANNLDGSLSRIDVDDLSVTSRLLARRGGAYGVAAAAGHVWVSNEYAGTLMRVTARTFQLGATVSLRGVPLGLAFVGDDLWFTNAAGGALHRGGVLTMVGPDIGYPDEAPDTDLTLHSDELHMRLAALTNDGLVGYRRVSGVQRAVLVPDLAVSLPKPTGGGLTYTFHLRKGVRYSTGKPVLAGDIRRGIERTVVHDDTHYESFTSAIVGAQGCRNAFDKAYPAGKARPDCDLRAGITADDRTGTVTFHLTKPTPDFLFQLTFPGASAVPQDTPVDLAAGTILPATGPYKIGSYAPNRLEFVRNPHFRAWSPAAQPDGYPDRIVLDTGYTEREALVQVTAGRADVLWGDVPLAELDRLRTRYGPQLHTTVGIYTNYLFLKATTPPFENLDARRAVAYALDRGELAGGTDFLSGVVTCQMIPPGFPAYRPYCPFTLSTDSAVDGHWAGPDVATARDLVKKSGTQGAQVVLAVHNDEASLRIGNRVQRSLRDLGYRASLRITADLGDFYTSIMEPSSDLNAGITGFGLDYPGASTLLGTVASCDGALAGLGDFNASGYCDPEVDKQITAALEQQVTDPGGASNTWAAIDRDIVDAAATIPFDNSVRWDFVSRRVGNTLVHPVTGPLVAQMWVH